MPVTIQKISIREDNSDHCVGKKLNWRVIVSMYFSLWCSVLLVSTLSNVKSCSRSSILRKNKQKHAWFELDLLWFCVSPLFSVILQPLLSKFSFLINLVSRNGSFILFLTWFCVSWSNVLLFDLSSTIAITAIVYFFLFPHHVIYKTFTGVRLPFFKRWWNGFYQLTTCFDNAAILIFVHFLCYHFNLRSS